MLFQAISSIGVGIIIGFIYSWKLTLLILCCLPLLVLGAMLEMKMAKGFSGKNDADLEEAGKVWRGVFYLVECYRFKNQDN